MKTLSFDEYYQIRRNKPPAFLKRCISCVRGGADTMPTLKQMTSLFSDSICNTDVAAQLAH